LSNAKFHERFALQLASWDTALDEVIAKLHVN
jgi:hypothetical protein